MSCRELVQGYKRYNIPVEKKSLSGLDAILNTLVGRVYKRIISPRKLRKMGELALALSLEAVNLSENELAEKLSFCRQKFRLSRKISDQELCFALGLITEAAFRALGMRPYAVQLMGVLAQYRGFAIEMKPGEGKTITAAMSGVLAAWLGKPCHIITSNDYLAGRDAVTMGPLFALCDVTVGVITAEMDENERAVNYGMDIVYATGKELLADFLRDQMHTTILSYDSFVLYKLTGRGGGKMQVMRGLHTAIVDEADSVLSDEATTPLIISTPTGNEILNEATLIAREMVQEMKSGEHYNPYPRFNTVELTKEGENFIEHLVHKIPPMWRTPGRREFLIKQAIIARDFYRVDNQYVVDEEGKVAIVDEKTGRIMVNRSWGAGLHQAIEAKEGVEFSEATETHTRMSFQRFFRLYRSLSGMSGTLQSLDGELWQIYRLPTIRIPKRINNSYKLLPVKFLSSDAEKWLAVKENVMEIHKTGRPILVGTRSIEESEHLAFALRQEGLSCAVLNAVHHEEEAAIIADAGQVGCITISTNMAGRGTDILIPEEVVRLGGLHVIATQKHESVRVDLQLFGRAARQGQPGTVQPIICLDDYILKQLCPDKLRLWLKEHFSFYPVYLFALLAYIYFQYKSEKIGAKVRSKILGKDFSLNDMLSFTIN
jgi:preprotein translocase subunit SecA